MNNNTKYIYFILMAILIFGAFSVGRFMRYKDTTKTGDAAKENIQNINSILQDNSIKLGITDSLLKSMLSSGELTVDGLKKIEESQAVQNSFINGVVSMMNNSKTNMDTFIKNYSGEKSSDDYAFELAIKQAEQLEIIESEYKKLLKDCGVNIEDL